MSRWMQGALAATLVAACVVPAALAQDAPIPPAMKAAPDFRQTVQSAKDKVFPAVVFLKCLRQDYESGRRVTQEVVGSGVIISPDGEAVSNWHVVDKAIEIRALMSDGRTFDVEVVGTDKDTDISLLRLKQPKDSKPLPFAKFGDSTKLREGDFVMAMGAPYGMNRSVSIGIISCTSRFLPSSSEYSHWLQTDASISPGNSGGPLVDTAGRIIGINTRGGSNVGFALPSENVKIVTDQLREFGKMNWSWTGLQLQPLRDFMKNIYFEGDRGVIVGQTEPDSPARAAKILKGDRLLSVNGAALDAIWVEDLPTVRRALGMLEKNKPATFVVQRNGKELKLEVTPREKGEVEGKEVDLPRWNMTVKSINQFDNEDLYFYRKKGVFVFGVKSPGNARRAGLEKDDILLKIGAKDVETLQDVRDAYDDAMKSIDKSHKILLTVLRNGLMKQIVLDYLRDYEKE